MQSERLQMRGWIGNLPIGFGLSPAATEAISTNYGLSPALAGGADGFPMANGTLINPRSWRQLWLSLLWIAAGGLALVLLGCGGAIQAGVNANPLLPEITSLSPVSPTADGSDFNLGINGTNFTPNSTTNWGSTPLPTTFVSTTKLTARVPASLISAPNTVSITVSTDAGTASATVSTTGGAAPEVALAAVSPPPTIASLSPSSVVAGTAAFTLTISGSNFLPGTGATSVKWGLTALTTTYISCTQITAVVPASLISSEATIPITVVTSGGKSSSVPFTINPPLPIISSFNPSQVPPGFGSFMLTIGGSHFTSASIVTFGTTPLVTAFAGSLIEAVVPANLVQDSGAVSVTVTTTGGTSAPATFTVAQPIATITSLSPSSIAAGSAPFTLTISGTNFNSASEVYFTNGIRPPTSYVNQTQLTAAIPAYLVASMGTVDVWVFNPGVGMSHPAMFTVHAAPPGISSLTPASVTAGGAGFMLTIKGTAFTQASTSSWGTTSLGTVFVSSTQLIAAVPANLIVDSGTGSVTVTDGAGTSSPAIFTINPAAPEIEGLNPSEATAGGAAFTMTIEGEYFTPTSTAKWGSTALATTYVSSSQLTAAIPAKLIANATTASITVATTAGTSAPAALTIYPAPKIVTVALPAATAGDAYSGSIKVTGGMPGYTWKVTGLSNNLSYYNTSGSILTITGTPTVTGTVNLQVSVEDTSGVTAGPIAFKLNVGSGPNGANNGSLNGNYVCLLQGFIDDDSTRWASVVNFDADGDGNFSAGIFDTNSHDIGSASGTITGSYSVGSDLNGRASLHTILTNGAAGIQTTQWALALTGATQPAQQFRMVEDDDLGELPSGQQGTADCQRATTSAFTASTVNGSSFAFGLEGEDGSAHLKAAAGVFSATAGKISSGTIDLAQGGKATVQTVAFTGTYTTPDPATGRFTIALKDGGDPAGLTAYIIDANRMFVLDNTLNDGEAAGNMRTRLESSFSAANMSGPSVLYTRGAEFNSTSGAPSGYYADLFQATGDGDGNIVINRSYTDANGVYSSGVSNGSSITLGFEPAVPGRATFQTASRSTYLYLFNNDSAFEMSVSDTGSVDTGWLEPQTLPRALSNTALAGSYLFSELQPLNGESDATVGEFQLTASGIMNEALTTAGEETLSWDEATSTTYALDATVPGTGAFLIASNTTSAASCAVINATKLVCIPQTDPSPSVQLIEQ